VAKIDQMKSHQSLYIKPQKQQRGYDIHIGCGLINQLSEIINLKSYTKIAVLTDSNLESLWLKDLTEAFSCHTITIKPGEAQKSVSALEAIWRELSEQRFDRKSLLINLGGGVIGDLGGFAAATYKRGMDFIQVPTTLLAQVDASIGGKTGINFAGIKNMVGSISQPAAVIVDPLVLRTLNDREFCSGCAEIVKHGLIQDRDYLEEIEGWDFKNLDLAKTEEIIRRSIEIKAEIVSADPLEQGLRKILNFGHTAGHAFEALSLEHNNNPLLHGEAVALGMMVEAEISHLMGYIEEEQVTRICHLISQFNLPTKARDQFTLDSLIERTQSDKKNVGGTTRWSLLETPGKAVFDIEVKEDLIARAFARVI